jgi:TPR repeat protein
MNGGLSDRTEAKKYYVKAAELGSATAINSLGLLIEPENKEEAMSLYRQAHKMGNLDATVNFALVYLQVSGP